MRRGKVEMRQGRRPTAVQAWVLVLAASANRIDFCCWLLVCVRFTAGCNFCSVPCEGAWLYISVITVLMDRGDGLPSAPACNLPPFPMASVLCETAVYGLYIMAYSTVLFARQLVCCAGDVPSKFVLISKVLLYRSLSTTRRSFQAIFICIVYVKNTNASRCLTFTRKIWATVKYQNARL